MFVVGGLCFLYIGRINEIFTFEMSLIYQMFISSWLVTFIELIAGVIINSNYAIWDYRNMPLNVMGQVCLPYTILWFLLSFPAIILDDYLRYWIFGEDKPHYTLFKSRR